MSTRTLNWYESNADAKAIVANSWNLQVAKAVATASAAPTYNLIWQSQALAPVTTVSWKVQYALSWAANVPSEGVAVKIQGRWQACNKGDSYDIDSLGYWVPSTSPTTPSQAGWLNVGSINYSYPGVLGIHIVVGVFNTQTNKYEAVFLDEATLPAGSSAKYQPQESVSWWLEASDLTGQVFHSTKSRSTTWDFSNPSDPVTNSYEWSTSFVMIGGKWIIAPGDPPQSVLAPPPSAQLAAMSLGGSPPVLLQIDYANWLITFAAPLTALAAVGIALYNRIKGSFKDVKVTIVGTDGTVLKVEYTAGTTAIEGTIEFLGTPIGATGSPQDTISGALDYLQTVKTIPATETWTIRANKATKAHTRALPTPEAPTKQFQNGQNGYQNGYQNVVGKGQYNQGFSNGDYVQGTLTPVA